MPLEEEVSLDISDALRQVDELESALTSAATAFKVALADALEPLQAVRVEDVDATAVTSSIDAAVDAADLTTEIQGDAGAVTVAIDDSIGAADKDVLLEPITAQITADIEDAIAAADATIEVVADTSGAESEMQSLSETVDSLGDKAEIAGEGIGGLASGANLLAAGTRAAAGDTAGLGSTLGGLGTKAGAALGIIGALGFAVGVFANQAIDAQTATVRFEDTFGDFAGSVNHVDIGGLNEDLSALALRLGADDDTLREAASSIAQIGLSSGKTQNEVAGTAEQITVLAARAAAMNPQLGTADQIVGQLTSGLARGGRFLGQFGIALTSAEISARALADTGKTSASELTIYEKAAAGAALATERLGNSIATDINEGADKPIIKLRALKQELLETFEDSGQGLVDPLVDSFEALTPVLVAAAQLLGPVLQVALLGLLGLLRGVAGVVGLVAHGFEQLFEAASHLPFVGGKFDDLAESARGTALRMDAVVTGADGAASGIDDAGDAADDAEPLFQKLAGAVEQTEESLNGLIDAEIAYLDSTIAAQNADQNFKDSLVETTEKLDDLTEAVRAHGRNSTEAKAAQRDYDDSIKAARDSALDAAKAQLRLAEDTAAAEGRTLTSEERQLTFRRTLIALATQATGPTKDAIVGLLAEIDKVAQNRTAKIDLSVADANANLSFLQRNLDALDRNLAATRRVVTTLPGFDFNAPGAMAGGTFEGGDTGQVIETGERGRELVFIGAGQSATVLPGSQSAALKAQNAALQSELVATLRIMRNLTATPAGSGVTVEELHVHEVTSDPRTTTFKIATDLGELARR